MPVADPADPSSLGQDRLPPLVEWPRRAVVDWGDGTRSGGGVMHEGLGRRSGVSVTIGTRRGVVDGRGVGGGVDANHPPPSLAKLKSVVHSGSHLVCQRRGDLCQ